MCRARGCAREGTERDILAKRGKRGNAEKRAREAHTTRVRACTAAPPSLARTDRGEEEASAHIDDDEQKKRSHAGFAHPANPSCLRRLPTPKGQQAHPAPRCSARARARRARERRRRHELTLGGPRCAPSPSSWAPHTHTHVGEAVRRRSRISKTNDTNPIDRSPLLALP